MSICNFVQLLFGLGGMLFDFLFLISTLYFQLAAVLGRRNSISQPAKNLKLYKPASLTLHYP
jgi:hypothetical protein